MDQEDVLPALQRNLGKTVSGLHLIPGVFTGEGFHLSAAVYDKILIHGVIPDLSNPQSFILRALQFLALNGMLRVGDVPNRNKKGHFLSSEYRHALNRSYKQSIQDKGSSGCEN
jgi:hypothetical protein